MTARRGAEIRPITYADLAEYAEAADLPGAAHLRESADAELADELEDARGAQEELEGLRELLDQVPEPTGGAAKHDEMCWRRHARCLADRLLDGEAA